MSAASKTVSKLVVDDDVLVQLRYPSHDVDLELAYCTHVCSLKGDTSAVEFSVCDIDDDKDASSSDEDTKKTKPWQTKQRWCAVAARMTWVVQELGHQQAAASLAHIRRAVGILFCIYTHASSSQLHRMRTADLPATMRVLDSGYVTLRALGVWNMRDPPHRWWWRSAAKELARRQKNVPWLQRLDARRALGLRREGRFAKAAMVYQHLIESGYDELSHDTLTFVKNIALYANDTGYEFGRDDRADEVPFEKTSLFRRGIDPITQQVVAHQQVDELLFPNRPPHATRNPLIEVAVPEL
jgi:hypothetical protein